MQKEEQIKTMIPLVRRISRRIWRLHGPALNYDDLFSWGLVGLWEACERYVEDRGVLFRTFAKHRIRGAILDGIKDHFRYHERFDFCDWVKDAEEESQGKRSNRLRGESDEGYYSILHDLASLPEKEQAVFVDHFLYGWNLSHIARSRQISRSWASRILKKALKKLDLPPSR